MPIRTTLLAAGFCCLVGLATAQERRVIATPAAPAAIGPYSQAIEARGVVYLAGQIAIDPATNQMRAGSIEDETRLTLDNLKAVLAAAGMAMNQIVSTTVYMADLAEFPRMNAVYATYFPEAPPARATVQVARLPRDAKVEIAAIAVR